MHTHPSWIEVSLTALRHNFHAVESHVQSGAETNPAIVCPVIKSDAYGHGAVGCALALEKAGAKWLAVSTTEEGVALRTRAVHARILVLCGFWPGEETNILAHGLTPTVWDRSHIELLEKDAEKHKPTQKIPIHLKVNTGMNRLGVDLQDLAGMCEALRLAPHLFLEGIFSHFAASEVVDTPEGEAQMQRFQEAVDRVQAAGFSPPIKHMANSAAMVSRPKSWLNLVRPGLAIYGYSLPLTSVGSGDSLDLHMKDLPVKDLPVKPALSWKTRVLQVRDVAAGQPVGYSSGYVTERPTKVAVLTVGYGDGLSRRLSSRGRVIVRNSYAPMIGNVSMNLTAVNVTDIPGVEAGDEAVMIGESAACRITACDQASLVATIPYEILCNISSRLPRKYVE